MQQSLLQTAAQRQLSVLKCCVHQHQQWQAYISSSGQRMARQDCWLLADCAACRTCSAGGKTGWQWQLSTWAVPAVGGGVQRPTIAALSGQHPGAYRGRPRAFAATQRVCCSRAAHIHVAGCPWLQLCCCLNVPDRPCVLLLGLCIWQDGGLQIPLHAYPCSGSPPVPKHLDLGHVPLGETAMQQLQLKCSTGVAFDYSITVLQHNKHFTIAPLSGTIPAHGTAAVTVTFTATKYSTEHLQLHVLLSEYGAEPMQVLVTGSCRPGLVQQKVLAAATGGVQSSGEPCCPSRQACPLLQHTTALACTSATELVCLAQIFSAWQAAKGSRIVLADRVCVLLGGVTTVLHCMAADGALRGSWQQTHDQAPRSPKASSKSPVRRAAGSPSAVSTALGKAQHITQHGVNMLLNQRPGKLQTKDIQVHAKQRGCKNVIWQHVASHTYVST